MPAFQPVGVDEIAHVIGQATAPAFLLGAIVGMLSLLTGRLARISDRMHVIRGTHDATDAELKRLRRCARHIRVSVACCAIGGSLTGGMVMLLFLDALLGYGNSRAIALLFIAVMNLFAAALLFFWLEVRLSLSGLTK
jgi:hypothetical protein